MDAHKNFAYSTVATAPSPAASGTSLVLVAGGGALLPAVPFNLVVWPVSAVPTSLNAEVVRVTDVTVDTLTIARQQEGSGARTIVVGDQVAAAIMAKMLDEPTVRDAPLYDVYIPAGQTLLVGDEMDAATNNVEVAIDGEVVSS